MMTPRLARAGAILISLLSLHTRPADAEDFPFTRRELSQKLDALSREKGIRAYLVQPRRCEAREVASGNAYFCEYSFFGTSTRVWSETDDSPVFMISSHTRNIDDSTGLILGLSALISVVDPQLPENEVTYAAERLASVDRTLSGKVELVGKDARYSSRIDRGNLVFMAVR